MALTDEESKDLSTPIYSHTIDGKPLKVLVPQQIDCDVLRNLLNHFHNAHSLLADQLTAAGDDKQAAYMKGVCKGLSIAWEKTYELERFGL